jgi:pyruvate,water dikinase
VVQGKVAPDQFYVHKATLQQGFKPVLWKKLGAKEMRMVYDDSGHQQVRNRPATEQERGSFSMTDDDILTLAAWSVRIEEHYTKKRGADTPMDIEWAKDGPSGELFIVQARPETVQSQKKGVTLRIFKLEEEGPVLASGAAVGDSVAWGRVRVVRSTDELHSFRKGDILVAENTDPDWEPVMKLSSAIVTDRGGRTSHAAIVARELGVPAVVGTGDATRAIQDGAEVTVSCAETDIGKVYAGKLRFSSEEVDVAQIPKPRTKIMLNAAQPEKALRLAQLPVDGVGLARMEFIFAGWVGIHPLALTRYESQPAKIRAEIDRLTAGYAKKTDFFVDKLAQGIATLAAAFWPRPVILRFSDFKTNEYAKLLGGEPFEPKEENPMLGWRGASRYYHPAYKEGFLLETAAVKRVREVFGLKNLKVMIPFCRTPAEGEQVLAAMREGGLERGKDGLEVYVMAEIPSNVLDAASFARIFDGFSIGSNDLTQLILGVDRDADRIASLFDERNPAVKRACAMLLETARRAGRPVGICGQAPSDYPDFAAFLVERGIDSISLNADAVIRTTREVVATEKELGTIPPGAPPRTSAPFLR